MEFGSSSVVILGARTVGKAIGAGKVKNGRLSSSKRLVHKRAKRMALSGCRLKTTKSIFKWRLWTITPKKCTKVTSWSSTTQKRILEANTAVKNALNTRSQLSHQQIRKFGSLHTLGTTDKPLNSAKKNSLSTGLALTQKATGKISREAASNSHTLLRQVRRKRWS